MSSQNRNRRVKVFSATMVADREKLGETITAWVRANKVLVTQIEIHQSSDHAFHCVSATAVYATGDAVGFVHESVRYSALEIYSATKAKEREVLGDKVGLLAPGDKLEVRQSSDAEFHCVTILVFRR